MSEMPHTVLMNRRLRDAVHAWRWADIAPLLAQGADANMLIDQEETLLTRIVATIDEKGATDVLDALLRAGANINGVGKDGSTPLNAALCRERPDLLEWLLKNGADPHLAPTGRSLPLQTAVEFDLADDVDFRTRILVAHGADPDKPSPPTARPEPTSREYLEQKSTQEQVFSATGIVDMYDFALTARRLLALLPPKVEPLDIDQVLRHHAARRNLRLRPDGTKQKPRGPGA